MTTDAGAALRSAAWGTLALAFHGAAPLDLRERAARVAQRARELGESARARAFESWLAGSAGENADCVRQDFHDLFTVPSHKYLSPYESVYVDPPTAVAGGRPKASCFGPSTVAVQRFYRRVGLTVARGYSELPDFAGLEMACMEFLCCEEAARLGRGDEPGAAQTRAWQRQFLQRHALRWLPALCARIQRQAATRFYVELARATADVLRYEAAALASDS